MDLGLGAEDERSRSEGKSERERREERGERSRLSENVFGSPNLIECALKILSVLNDV